MSMWKKVQATWIAMLVMVFPLVSMAGGTGGVTNTASMQAAGATSRPAAPKANFLTTKGKADRVTEPLDAVVIWQAFIDGSPSPEDLEKAQAELKMWQDRVDDEAAIINKKWVGGKEREAIQKKVEGLLAEFETLSKADKTLEGIKKLEEASKIWPENYIIQFELGGIALDKRDLVNGIRYFEACQRIKPGSPAIMNNLGVLYVIKRQGMTDRGIQLIYKSVKAQETKENVQNLVTALGTLPSGAVRGTKYKEYFGTAHLLMEKYKITGPTERFWRMNLRDDRGSDEDEDRGKDGVVGNGSGFVISADGLILTNKHVAGAGTSVMIKFNDGTQKTGEIVVIDDEQDLALIRVKMDKPLQFVKLAKYDNPPDAAMAVVMGFPVMSMVGEGVKTTVGTVASGNNAKMTSDVTLDARVNPGNSGGPVYDKFGHVMAIIAQKTLQQAGGAIDTYGLAISNGRIRKFLAKNNITLESPSDSDPEMNAQQVSEKNKMSTVCILIVGKGK